MKFMIIYILLFLIDDTWCLWEIGLANVILGASNLFSNVIL